MAVPYPIHVVRAEIGTSERIAAKHYLQVTDDHFDQAVKASPGRAQNPAQYSRQSARKDRYKKERTLVIPEEYEGLL